MRINNWIQRTNMSGRAWVIMVSVAVFNADIEAVRDQVDSRGHDPTTVTDTLRGLTERVLKLHDHREFSSLEGVEKGAQQIAAQLGDNFEWWYAHFATAESTYELPRPVGHANTSPQLRTPGRSWRCRTTTRPVPTCLFDACSFTRVAFAVALRPTPTSPVVTDGSTTARVCTTRGVRSPLCEVVSSLRSRRGPRLRHPATRIGGGAACPDA